MDKIYIHYGHKQFFQHLFQEIKNRDFVKPSGGLWASDINADYGWKEWTENNNFMTNRYNNDNYFKFKLKDNARILYLKDEKDLKKLPKNNSEITRLMKMCGTEYLDFEKLKQDYDAIEVEISKLYWTLYGWDCDSILVMNKEVIELI